MSEWKLSEEERKKIYKLLKLQTKTEYLNKPLDGCNLSIYCDVIAECFRANNPGSIYQAFHDKEDWSEWTNEQIARRYTVFSFSKSGLLAI